MQFAQYNRDEISPEALAMLHKWLLGTLQLLEDANMLTQRDVAACVPVTPDA